MLGSFVAVTLVLSACSAVLGLDKNYTQGSGGSAGADASAGSSGSAGTGGSAGADASAGSSGSAGTGGSAGSSGGDASLDGAGTDSATGGPTVVQEAPAATSGAQESCIVPNVQAGDALVVVVKECVSPNNITVTDSSGATYVAPTSQLPDLRFFGSFDHAAGPTTITVSGNAVYCFLLLDCMEASGVQSFVATGGLVYGSIGISRTGTTSSPSASATYPELLIGTGEVEGQTVLGTLSDYGSGGGTPTGFQQMAVTPAGAGAQMWSAYQVIRDSKQYGLQRTLNASANGVGAVVVLSKGP